MFHWVRRCRLIPILILPLLLAWAAGCAGLGGGAATPEPIVPTRTPRPATEPATLPVETISAPPPEPTPLPAIPTLTAGQAASLSRIGVAGALEYAEPVGRLGLRFGHLTFWRVAADLPDVPGLTVWQTVRLGPAGEGADWPQDIPAIEAALRAQPGSFWLIGNEPDVRWQDNATAAEYATGYHDVYTFIKERDPSARIGAGGIALPTPLRLAYLDEVLRVYQEQYGRPMPADLWSIHLFTLREEADSWGIGIPPGMDDRAGQLYEIEDHGDIELLKAHVAAFRAWMAANGYGDKPLAVTEFGILLPEDYGFSPEFVSAYLVDAYDYLLTATGETGLAADGGRLVQYAFWYSLYDDGQYPTGNLYNGRGALTALGEAYKQYVEE
jgi:hypothetical protein